MTGIIRAKWPVTSSICNLQRELAINRYGIYTHIDTYVYMNIEIYIDQITIIFCLEQIDKLCAMRDEVKK
jgi:hypothetical protein